MIPFSFKMAWRETRGNWRQFLFFFACIAIGVGSVVGVGLFSANVKQVIFTDARSLLGGDLEVRLVRPISDAGLSVLNSLRHRGIAITHVSELVGMAATSEISSRKGAQPAATQLVELKAVDGAYPLYGKVVVEPAQPLPLLLTPPATMCEAPLCYGAIVQESLLIRLGIHVGSSIKIGQSRLIVTGVLLKEPDRVASAFSLGPRVMISRQALTATDLIQPGSRIRERYLLRLPPTLSLGAIMGELQGRLAEEGARVTTYREAQPRIRRFLHQLSTYLGLIGLTALFVGGIGVACTVQGFIAQKITHIAILKAVGADASMIVRIYLSQSLLLGGIGSILGAGLGAGMQALAPYLLQGMAPVALTTHVFPFPVIKGLALGMLSTMLFTLWPLLVIRNIPPALVFRREVDQSVSPFTTESFFHKTKRRLLVFLRDRIRWGTALVMVCGLAGLAMWQAQSISLGLVFIAAFTVGITLLLIGVKILLFLLPTRLTSPSFVFRHALANIRRPGNFTAGMAVSIGVGVMVMVAISSIKTSLLDAIGDQIPDNAPSFFFVDIQPDQKEEFERLLRQWIDHAAYELTPVVRSRLSAVNGRKVDPRQYKNKRNGWYFTREYVLTSLSDLPEDNDIVNGHWWFPETSLGQAQVFKNSVPLISVEAEAARNLGVEVGGMLEFDIQGTPLSTKVASMRKVDWSSFSTNFFMILSPGSLDDAPLTYIATAQVGDQKEIPLQRAMVSALPNVTAIKVGDVLQNVANLLRQLAWAIQGLAALCLLSGTVVMIAALSANRYRRLYESAILKALGGTRRVILQSFAMEFGIVGALAGLIGIGLGSVLSWAILTFFLDLTWTVQPGLLGNALILTILLALTVGLLSSFRVLAKPPLAVLRQE